MVKDNIVVDPLKNLLEKFGQSEPCDTKFGPWMLVSYRRCGRDHGRSTNSLSHAEHVQETQAVDATEEWGLYHVSPVRGHLGIIIDLHVA